MTVSFGIPMNSTQKGMASVLNRFRARKQLFATHTPSSGGVGVQPPVEDSKRRPATGAINLNCMTATDFSEVPMELSFGKVLDEVEEKPVYLYLYSINVDRDFTTKLYTYMYVCATKSKSQNSRQSNHL